MKIELEPEQEELAESLIKQGRFASPADVVGASLELIQSEEEWKAYAQQRIDAGVAAMERDDFDPEGAIGMLFTRYKLTSA